MSESWWRDIFVHMVAFGIDPTEIIHAVHHVEAGKPNSDVTVTEFRDESLKAVWHKHYFSARYLPANIFPARGRNGLNTIVDEILDPVKYPVITPQAIDELAQAVATLPVKNRSVDGNLTGKWVIFAKHDGKNYYLGLARTIGDLQQDF